MNSTRKANQDTDVAITTRQVEANVSAEIEEGNTQSVSQAKDIASKKYSVDMVDVLVNQETPEQGALLVANQAAKSANTISDFLIEDAATRGNPFYSDIAATVARRQQRALEIVEEQFKKSNEGTVDVVLDFFDRFFIRHMPIGLYEDITNRSERKGAELLAKFTDTTITDAEWEEYYTEYSQEVADEGVFRSDNWFAIQQLANETMNAGYDPASKLDQFLGIGELASLGLGSALRAGKTISRISALKGTEEAADAASTATHITKTLDPELEVEKLPTALNNSGPAPGPATQTAGGGGGSGGGGVGGGVGGQGLPNAPTQVQVSQAQARGLADDLITEIGHMVQKGSLGVDATPQQIADAELEIVEAVANTTGRAIADVDYQSADFSGYGYKDYGVSVKLGRKTDGAPFAPQAKGAAEKLAKTYRDNGFAADVVEAQPGNPGSGWNVQINQRLDLSSAQGTLSNPLDPKVRLFNGIRQLMLNLFGSQRSIISEFDNQLSLLGEGFESAVRQAAEPYLKKVRDLPVQNQKVLNGVMRELRDGKDAYLRQYYTQPEFATKYKALHPDGKAATKADYEAFMAAVTLNDTAYYLKANKIMRWYVRNEYKALDIDDGLGIKKGALVKNVDELDDDTFVWSPNNQATVRLSDIPEAERIGIWKLENPLENGAQYVHNPKKVRALAYDDVLGYNAGGARLNPKVNYFVVVGKGVGRALLGTFSIKQAKLAEAELGTLRSAYLSGNLTDDLVLANNTWNPNITSAKDFDDLVQKKNWDLNQEVGFKKRGDTVEEDVPMRGETYDTYQMSQFSRNYDVLMEFGGEEVANLDPLAAITKQMNDGVAELSLRNYNQSAKASWLRKAGYTRQVEEGKQSLDLLFDNADLSNIKDPATRRQLEVIRDNINVRNGVQSELGKRLENYTQQLAEFVFDTTDKIPGMKGLKPELRDPTGFLMNIGFHTAFGFTSVSQFVLQAFHMTSIMAISPRAGAKGAAVIPALRLAIHADRTKGVTQGYARIANFMGVPKEQIEELAEYIKISGREIIESDAVEKGTGASADAVAWNGRSLRASVLNKAVAAGSKAARVAGKISILPFSEGEKLTRYTGMTTAAFEYMAKNPGKSILTPEARGWIAARQDDLTFNMTNASRSKWQTGAFRLPMQWMSYSFRAMEAVVVGGALTWGERARLGTMMAITTGLFGMTAEKAADYVADELGMEPGGLGYVSLKYGAFDGVLSWALSGLTDEQVRTAFGTRLSPIAGLMDFWEGIYSEDMVTTFVGPSGQIVANGASALFSSLSNLVHGRTEMAKADLYTLARTPSGLNNILSAQAIIQTGTNRSRGGNKLAGEWTDVDALLKGMGITNFREAEYYGRKEIFWKEDKEIRQFRKDINNTVSKANELLKAGDRERGERMLREASDMIESSGFSPADKMSIRSSLLERYDSFWTEAIIRYMRQDNSYAAQTVESAR